MATIIIPSNIITIFLTAIIILSVVSLGIKMLRQFFKNLDALRTEIGMALSDKTITDTEVNNILKKWDKMVSDLNSGYRKILGKLLSVQ